MVAVGADKTLHPSTHPVVRHFWTNLCARDSTIAAQAVLGLRKAVECGTGEAGSGLEDSGTKRGRPGSNLSARLFELESLALALTRLTRADVVLGGIRMLGALVQISEGGGGTSVSRCVSFFYSPLPGAWMSPGLYGRMTTILNEQPAPPVHSTQRRQRLASELRMLLDTGPLRVGAVDGWKVLEAAADATGALAEVCASLGDMATVESFVAPALAVSRDPIHREATAASDSQHYAAMLVFARLAAAAPLAVFEKRWPLLEVIWNRIGDACQAVREAAASALGALLKLVHAREGSDRTYRLALREAEAGFVSDVPERVHGALLVVRQLLEHPGPWMIGARESVSVPQREADDLNPWWLLGPGQVLGRKGGGELSYVEEKLRSFCPLVLARRDSSLLCIREAVMAALPLLARYSEDLESGSIEDGAHPPEFLEPATWFLITTARQGGAAERKLAYVSLAQLGSSVGPAMQTRSSLWSAVIRAVHEGLEKGASKGILQCVVMAVWVTSASLESVSLGDDQRERASAELTELVGELVSSQRLTGDLVRTLRAVVVSMPSLNGVVREGLLRQLARVLGEASGSAPSGDGRRRSGHQSVAGSAWLWPTTARTGEAEANWGEAEENQSQNEVIIALDVLGNYDFYSEHNFGPALDFKFDRDKLGSDAGSALSITPPRPSRRHLFWSDGELARENTESVPAVNEQLCRAFRLLKGYALRFMDSSNSLARLAAVSAACNLLIRAVAIADQGGESSFSSSWGLEHSLSVGSSGNPFHVRAEWGSTVARDSEVPDKLHLRSLSNASAMSRGGPSFAAVTYWEALGCGSVLARLVAAGLSDESDAVRASVFRRLCAAPQLDPFVASLPRHCLLDASHDKAIQVRRSAVSIAARAAASRHPVSLAPFLTRALVSLTRHQEVTRDARLRRDQVLLVTDIVASAGPTVRPFIPSILPPLIRELRKDASLTPPSPVVAAAALAAVSEVSAVSPDDIVPLLDSVIFPAIVDCLHDTSSLAHQVIAMEALAQVAGATGRVILPYFRHAGLLRAVLSALMCTDVASAQLRSAALRAVGVLGALDPFKFRQMGRSFGAGAAGVLGGPHNTAKKHAASDLRVQRLAEGIVGDGSLDPLSPRHVMDLHESDMDPAGNPTHHLVHLRDGPHSAGASLPESSAGPGSNGWYAFMAAPEVLLQRGLGAMEAAKVVAVLLNMISNPSLSIHHQAAVATVMEVCERLSHESPALHPDEMQIHFSRVLRALAAAINREAAPAGKTHFVEYLFNQIGALVLIGGDIMGPSDLSILLALLQRFWAVGGQGDVDSVSVVYMPLCLRVVDALHSSMGSDRFRLLLPDLMPLMIDAMNPAHAVARSATRGGGHVDDTVDSVSAVILSVARTRDSLCEYIPLAMATLLRLVVDRSCWLGHRRLALLCALHLSAAPGAELLAGQSGPLIHTLLEVVSQSEDESHAMYDDHHTTRNTPSTDETAIKNGDPEGLVRLQQLALAALNCVACRMRQDYLPFVRPAWSRLAGAVGTPAYEGYRNTVARLVRGSSPISEPPMPEIESELPPPPVTPPQGRTYSRIVTDMDTSEFQHHFETPVDQSALIAALDTSSCTKARDWEAWMRRVGLELLRQSPSPLLQLCAPLAAAHPPIAEGLLRPSFLAMWVWLEAAAAGTPWGGGVDGGSSHANALGHVLAAVEAALRSSALPAPILSQLLNLAEYMELQDKSLPLEAALLARRAAKANALAKLLYYREQQFLKMMSGTAGCGSVQIDTSGGLHTPCRLSPSCVESLISVNHRLDLPQAAAGILQHAQHLFGPSLTVQPAWMEQVGRQEEALALYRELQLSAQNFTAPEVEGQRLLLLPLVSRRSISEDIGALSAAEDEVRSSASGAERTQGAEAVYYEAKLGELRCLDSLGQYDEVAGAAMELYFKLRDKMPSLDDSDEEEDGPSRLFGSVSGDISPSARALRNIKISSSAVELGNAPNAPPGSLSGVQRMVRSQTNLSLSSAGTGVHQSDEDSRRRQGSRPGIKNLLSRQNALTQWETWLHQASSLGARAYLALQKWDELSVCVRSEYSRRSELASQAANDGGDEEEATMLLLLSVVDAERGDLAKARQWIQHARERLGPCISSLLHESYSRSYSCLVTLQELAEVEEVVEFMEAESRGSGGEKALTELRAKWDMRLRWMPEDTSIWRRVLSVRSLLLDREQDLGTWLRMASLARKRGNLTLCANTLRSIGAEVPPKRPLTSLSPTAGPCHPSMVFGLCKYMWDGGMRKLALERLEIFRDKLLEVQEDRVGSGDELAHAQGSGSKCQPLDVAFKKTCSDLAMRALLTCSKWRLAQWEELHAAASCDHDSSGTLLHHKVILDDLKRATELDSESYQAWHEWGVMNCRLKDATAAAARTDHTMPASSYVINAVHAFFRSISLGRNQPAASVLQDTLRLLTLWFEHGNNPAVDTEVAHGLQGAAAETWLGVIPQLIARVHTRNVRVNALLRKLLIRIGRDHPQALIYPITVASESSRNQSQGQNTSCVVLRDMRARYTVLVDEATLVSRELNQVAASIAELWLEGLEHASRLMVVDGDRKSMLAKLRALHDMPRDSSARGTAFRHVHSRDLTEAEEWLNVYEKSGRELALLQAWSLYHRVHRIISRQLASLATLDLGHVAPALLASHNLQLAVPGTYRPHADVVKIDGFLPKVKVIGWSKQRPRRITMHSSRGQQYTFLLKGREDLRQDERVMQLFGLVNALLADARTTARTGLSIQRYVVMPLSNSSGLIGWVPNCDTLHQLVRSYRESREIRVSSEHKALQHAAPDYDRLPLLGKLEVFEQACSTTDGQELARVLWLSSASSEVWLERRTAYIRSLAVMSMAGYILGLGDRHPSNLMLDRVTGRVVHIDFGDCFEVSMQRERYPETVPFRLTRMIVNAMGASRIEGYFRTTCELVMGPLRANRDSLTAMLEAFVHDPLISWRLLSAPSPPQPHARHSSDSSVSKSRSASEVGTIDDNENIDGDIDEIGYGKVVSSPGSPDEGRPLRNIAMSMLGTTPQSNDPGKPRQAAAAGLDRADAEQGQPKEELNAKAVAVLARIQMKLTGRDFGNEPLDVSNQVDQLISQATSPNNLCQLYMGWLPFW